MSDHGGDVRRLEDLFDQVQAVLAGHPLDTALQALLKSLVVIIAVTAGDLPHAEAMIDGLPDTLIPVLRAAWPQYRARLAKRAAGQPGAPADRRSAAIARVRARRMRKLR